MRDVETGLRESDGVKGVISPLDRLDFSASLVQSADGNPLNSIASKALSARRGGGGAGRRHRERRRPARPTSARPRDGCWPIPTDQQTLDNPEWVKFLLYDNQGEVRKALRTFFPDDTHAQIITRLDGNQSIKDQGVVQVSCSADTYRIQQLRDVETGLRETDGVKGVISPLTALEFSASLVQSSDGNPLNSIASKALSDAEASRSRPATPPASAARQADFGKTAERLLGDPARTSRPSTTPSGSSSCSTTTRARCERRSGPSSPTSTHAQIITRLDGNQSIKVQGVASDGVVGVTGNLDIPGHRHGHDRRAGPAQEHQRLPPGRHAHPRRHRGRGDDRDPAAVLQRQVAAAPARRRAGGHHLGVRSRPASSGYH